MRTHELRSMGEFDPDLPCLDHDKLNDVLLEWRPSDYAESYLVYGRNWEPGVVEWDGQLLDGWIPLTVPSVRGILH